MDVQKRTSPFYLSIRPHCIEGPSSSAVSFSKPHHGSGGEGEISMKLYDSYHDTSLPVREYSMAAPQGRVPYEVEHPRPRGIFSGAAVPVKDLAEQTYLGAGPPFLSRSKSTTTGSPTLRGFRRVGGTNANIFLFGNPGGWPGLTV